jgi:hypothetical protein
MEGVGFFWHVTSIILVRSRATETRKIVTLNAYACFRTSHQQTMYLCPWQGKNRQLALQRIAPALKTSLILKRVLPGTSNSLARCICVDRNKQASTLPSAYVVRPVTLCLNSNATLPSSETSWYVWNACPFRADSGTCMTSICKEGAQEAVSKEI